MPSRLGELQSWVTLDFTDTGALQGANPTALGGIDNLEVFSFSANDLTEGIPSGLANLENLLTPRCFISESRGTRKGAELRRRGPGGSLHGSVRTSALCRNRFRISLVPEGVGCPARQIGGSEPFS